MFEAASGMAFTLTAGYVSWLLRAGYLSASVMSMLPIWGSFDPLPVLGKKRAKKKDPKDGEKGKDLAEPNDLGVEDAFFESTGN